MNKVFSRFLVQNKETSAMNPLPALHDEENEDTGNLTGVEPEGVASQEQRGQKQRLSVQGG